MLRLFAIWAGCMLLLGPEVYSQSLKRTKLLPIDRDSIIIDTLSIVPGSVRLFSSDSTLIPTGNYRINYPASALVWINRSATSQVRISYTVFPFLLTKKHSHKSSSQIGEAIIDNSDLKNNEKTITEENTIFSLNGLSKSGSISRSVGVGNSQDLTLNSNMTLQLSGKITEDLEITAAISDDNIPIQPEGNTQQLNQFDKVFIQLKKKNSILTGGDFELRRPDSYFMNFYKRTQGGSFSTAFSPDKKWLFKTTVAAAVAKGRSSRFSFQGIEGNQGPYRISGNSGEQFIIILSGTERVFVDGILQVRGQENDYVIDYNTAELTFTSRRLITQNSRIIVEFEYSDKNYARALTYLNQEVSGKRLNFRFNYYNEQDNVNQPFLQTLNDSEKAFLKTIGNNINQAYFENVDTVSFSENEILYKKTDTLGASGVYVYSTDKEHARYRLGFTFVGQNKGNYRLSSTSAANGRVFEYVPSVSGIMQGDYEPVTLLITPKKQQLITFGGDFKAGKSTLLGSELAFSNNDVNLFSDLGNKQNQGLGIKLYAKNETPLSRADGLQTKLITGISYERTSSSFKPIERYREVEFERNFNLSGLTGAATEHLSSFSLGVYKEQYKNINYRFTSFVRESIYNGYEHNLTGMYNYHNYTLSYSGRLLNSSSILNKSHFLRQQADFSKKIKSITTGINFEQENNNTKDSESNISASSFSYNQYKAYLRSAFNSGNALKVEYYRRYDRLPDSVGLKSYSVADVLSSNLELNKNPNSLLNISSTYRNLKFKDPQLKENERTLLGRIDYTLTLLKGFFNSNIFYELGPGREPKREFSYLEVITGQGVYTWNDYNNNGIKELNEFEIARFRDQARYIRIFQPTNEFISTNYTTINYSLRLSPQLLLKKKQGPAQLLSRFSTQTAFKTERKTSGLRGLAAYDPFRQIVDERLISDNTFFRNTIFFNRNSPTYGIDFNYQKSANKTLLINGFDGRSRNEAGLRFRCNIKKANLVLEAKQGAKRYESELFDERNYRITFYDLLPELNYQFNNNFRLSFLSSLKQQNNHASTGEQATNLKVGSEARYTIVSKGTITSSVNLVNNKFTGAPNSPVAYEMLEGLQVGNNLVWTSTLQRAIAKGVQMNLSYEGRKSAEVKTIHTGSVQFRAFF